MPAIRTLKINVFYPKNSQKSHISVVVGSRYTSDDSPTVTQTYRIFTCIIAKCRLQLHVKAIMHVPEGVKLGATPAIRTFESKRVLPKNQ